MSSGNLITEWSATEIAQRIASRQVTAREVCQAHIARCEAVQPQLNALFWTRYEAALVDATTIDERIANGESVGPLAGVPITLKDSFFLEGSPAGMGIPRLQRQLSTETNVLVQRLQRAGAIVLGKTNVPQLMILHECVSPLHGQTNNPWNLDRTSGGSSGGEAALIAAGGSALGLGSDLGGSIRIPAGFCGVQGLKPTSKRLPNTGVQANFRGFEGFFTVAGPIARNVEDLDLAMRVLADHSDGQSIDSTDIRPWCNFREVDLSQLRIGLWLDDGNLLPSLAIQRAVREAGAALQQAGATVEEFSFPFGERILEIYVGLLQADGCADLRRIAGDSGLDWRVGRILLLAGLRRLPRAIVYGAMRMLGQRQLAKLVAIARPRSTDEYWQLIRQRNAFQQELEAKLAAQKLDAIICPSYALPAPQHGKTIDLMTAASYAFLPNLFSWPAGVVGVTKVREGEQNSRASRFDRAFHQAKAVDEGSIDMPVGVQCFAPAWREDVVLAVMNTCEEAFSAAKGVFLSLSRKLREGSQPGQRRKRENSSK